MVKYTPARPPDTSSASPQDVIEWAKKEFEVISRNFQEHDITGFKVTNVAPPKPREGNMAFADGTNWNPGSGRGLYEYRGGTWQKL
jgi:hypothetical protein